jgi:N-methylhydantoinase A
MEAEARAWLKRERVPENDQSFRYHIDARYQGQNFEVMVAMPRVAADGMAGFLDEFAAAHQREYGYDVPGRAVEIVNCRLHGRRPSPRRRCAKSALLAALPPG